MNGNSETSSSTTFAPMPMSALLAHLVPLNSQEDSPDCSFSSEDESNNSYSETVAKKPSVESKSKPNYNKNTDKAFITPNVKSRVSKENRVFASEKKTNERDQNKENASESSISNQTYPNRYALHGHNNVLHSLFPNSEVKKRGVLTPKNENIKTSSSDCTKTPEMVKAPKSSQKLKSATPKIKSGIRKFTPGSARKSQKKTPQKAVIQNRDKVRCELFSQSHQDDAPQSAPSIEVLQAPVPNTPMSRNPLPPSYAATPSQPQGLSGNNSKILFKITYIKNKKYMYLKKLGIGGSSEVYKVLEVGSSCEYAVKCVNLATDPDLARGYINEVRLLRELQNSDRVIRLFDYEYDRTNQFLRMVLEVGETDLSSFLQARRAGLSPTLILHFWEEMLHAVHYIHERGVIHADLKPANFLMVMGRLKLIDFGIASAVAGDATSVVRAHAAGTYSYISPEALMGGAGGYGAAGGDGSAPIKISFRSDVWSLGCILYSMLYGKTPFAHIASLAKLAVILDPNHRIEYPPLPNLPASLVSSVKWCLKYNVRERPAVRQLLAVPHLAPPRAPSHALLTKLKATLTTDELHELFAAQELQMLQ